MTEFLKDLLLPSHLAAGLCAAGGVLLLVRSMRSRARTILALGAAVYFVFSNGMVATALIRPLEYRYPAVQDYVGLQDIDAIVVLTAYAIDDPSLSVMSRASGAVAFRVLETVRVFRESQASEIIVSGSATAAELMAEMLAGAGIPESAIHYSGDAVHTSDSAGSLADRLSGRRFFLVSSAGHLPRAMGVFRTQGLDPVPVPTDYQLSRQISAGSLGPSPLHLQASDLAVNEYAGLLWYRVSGRIR